MQRRADRKIAREKREKDNKKQAMLDEINKFMVDKGANCVSGIASEILLDVHGCYEKRPFLGALGGQIQQWYYVINAISELYANEDLRPFYKNLEQDPKSVTKANTPRELIMDQFMVPFLLLAIKELKPDFIQLVNTPQTQKMCEMFRIPMPSSGNGYDLSRLTKE